MPSTRNFRCRRRAPARHVRPPAVRTAHIAVRGNAAEHRDDRRLLGSDEHDRRCARSASSSPWCKQPRVRQLHDGIADRRLAAESAGERPDNETKRFDGFLRHLAGLLEVYITPEERRRSSAIDAAPCAPFNSPPIYRFGGNRPFRRSWHRSEALSSPRWLPRLLRAFPSAGLDEPANVMHGAGPASSNFRLAHICHNALMY